MEYRYDYKVKLKYKNSSIVKGTDREDAYNRAYGIIKYAIKHNILDVRDFLDVEITKFEPCKKYYNCKRCNIEIIQSFGLSKGRYRKYCSDACKQASYRQRRDSK